jgi:predicted GH43/DUF377 family glycosyl hydrolase
VRALRRSLAGAVVLYGFGLMPYFGSAAATFPPTGANWTRSTSSPVLSPSQAWEQTAVSEVARVISGVTWKMWYTGGWTHPGIGYATSSDGITWTRYAGTRSTARAARATRTPRTVRNVRPKVGHVDYYLYSSGGANPTTPFTTFRVATSTDGIAWTTQASSISFPSAAPSGATAVTDRTVCLALLAYR